MTAENIQGPPGPGARTAAHLTEDVHEILRAVAELQQGVNIALGELLGAVTLARRDVAELAEKVGQLEQEFGPLARKYSGGVARIAAGRAAGFMRSKGNDQSDG